MKKAQFLVSILMFLFFVRCGNLPSNNHVRQNSDDPTEYKLILENTEKLIDSITNKVLDDIIIEKGRFNEQQLTFILDSFNIDSDIKFLSINFIGLHKDKIDKYTYRNLRVEKTRQSYVHIFNNMENKTRQSDMFVHTFKNVKNSDNSFFYSLFASNEPRGRGKIKVSIKIERDIPSDIGLKLEKEPRDTSLFKMN